MKNVPVIGTCFFRVDRSSFKINLSPVIGKIFVVLLSVFFISLKSFSQCPVNLGFELGTFDNWECVTGKISTSGVITIVSTPPLKNKHTIYPKDSKELDKYGKFPVVCPNGSKYSVRLGNDSTGAEVDGLSYTFTVPPGVDDYSMVYNYAVVFENPDHSEYQQPRFTAKVFDVSANQYIACSSFDFTASGNLPGFKRATLVNNLTAVFYKPWSSVSLKLLGYAGKTLRIEFFVNDCSLSAHFGYAYFDVNEDCGALIGGSIICNGPTSGVLTAPYGFQDYNWYTSDFSRLLGKGNILSLDPLPPQGTSYALEIFPYPGSGCRDTLYTKTKSAPVPFTFKPPDTTGVCQPGLVDLTALPATWGNSAGLKISYYLDSSLQEFAPEVNAIGSNGVYYIKATNTAGCLDVTRIVVKIDTIPKISVRKPAPIYYPNTVDITDLSLIDGHIWGMAYTYWKDALTTIALPNPQALGTGGMYYIKSSTTFGCEVVLPIEVTIQIAPPPNAFSPNGDGINDLWEIPSLVPYPQCSVDVYDRSGRPVFHSTGYSKPWDGKYNGKQLPLGTYYFVIKGTDNLKPVSGSVTLIY